MNEKMNNFYLGSLKFLQIIQTNTDNLDIHTAVRNHYCLLKQDIRFDFEQNNY